MRTHTKLSSLIGLKLFSMLRNRIFQRTFEKFWDFLEDFLKNRDFEAKNLSKKLNHCPKL